MNSKRNINRFDTLVEKLTNELIKIPNFHLTKDDETSNTVFSKIIFRTADIASYKELVTNHFIPAANRAISLDKRDLQKSKHKYLININQIEFEETLYDTIRVSYVGLFHKFENYINDVILIPELIFGDIYETNESVYNWAKEIFAFDIKDWRQFKLIHKINWISNCVKHKDGFPTKDPKPYGFENLDPNQRIRIKPEEFKSDCQSLIEFYPHYLRTFLLIAHHKSAKESLDTYNDEIKLEFTHKIEGVEEAIKKLVLILRQLG